MKRRNTVVTRVLKTVYDKAMKKRPKNKDYLTDSGWISYVLKKGVEKLEEEEAAPNVPG